MFFFYFTKINKTSTANFALDLTTTALLITTIVHINETDRLNNGRKDVQRDGQTDEHTDTRTDILVNRQGDPHLLF